MPTNEQLITLAQRVLYPNYRPPPFVLVRGRGCRVWDADDHEYLDFSGGIAVVALGHAHPRLAHAIGEQAATLMHTSNLFYNANAIEFAAAIVERTPFDRVYFGNSGTEANEALIKLARRWHYEHGRKERVELVAAEQSFHGRTMGSVTLTGQPKYHTGMGPLVPGVKHVPYNDLDALREAVTERTAAVFLEPIQGEGGIVAGTKEYLRGARELCDAKGALLFFDEVQTGYGRTGRFLAWEHSGVEPDGCSLAKGMGGGFPIGAIAVKEHLQDGLPPGSHATTFGGNPLACAAGLAVLRIFDEERVIENARAMGDRLGRHLADLGVLPSVVEARGVGLLRGVLLHDGVDPQVVLRKLREEQRMLATLAGARVIRLAPPLNVEASEIDEAVAKLRAVLAEVAP
ncbi:MAG: aspartate aminotransferase family protein [Sandaracinaceae bacterium]|nr:aspartate aminotransferase family protein [Sandaracinaceae bacterium]